MQIYYNEGYIVLEREDVRKFVEGYSKIHNMRKKDIMKLLKIYDINREIIVYPEGYYSMYVLSKKPEILNVIDKVVNKKRKIEIRTSNISVLQQLLKKHSVYSKLSMKNTITCTGYQWIALLLGSYIQANASLSTMLISLQGATMQVGTDQNTVTYCQMTQLAKPIDVPPTSIAGGWGSGVLTSASGLLYASLTAVWNSGVLPSATIGEVGVYFNMPPLITQNTFNNAPTYVLPTVTSSTSNLSLAPLLFSRLSYADGTFALFNYNNLAPLAFQWILQLIFVQP